MKLLKIGSSQSCDIVLHSSYVSSMHAEITLMDNGEIILVDKNSTNGTFVGNKKLEPNREVQLRRGDYVRFGDTDLVWSRIPMPEKNINWKKVLNIGSHYRNDIVVNSEVVSRFHCALKIDKHNKAFIIDNNSKNGTQINGERIQSGKPYRIKKGDNVICGSEDITDQLDLYLKPAIPQWAIWLSGIVAAAAVFVGAFFLFNHLRSASGIDMQTAPKAVVYVRASFHYVVTVENNILNNEHKDLLTKETPETPYQATAFFIDEKGRLATNRHVAVPWDEAYREEGLTEKLISEYKKFINESLQVTSIDVLTAFSPGEAIEQLQRSELGRAIINESEGYDDVMAKVEILRNSKVVISGKIDDITVGYPGQYYNNEQDFQRCHVLAESESADKDIAILELNEKVTPSSIKAVFSMNNVFDGTLAPQKDELIVVGFPLGIEWNQSEQTKSLEPNIKTTRCSKTPDRYVFEFQESSIGGSSGSPIFNKKGELVGILSAGIHNQTISLAVHAKYLKELYDQSTSK